MIDDSESEVEEDPDFPVPTSYSDDEDDQGSPLPIVICTHPLTSSTQSLQGKTTILHYTKTQYHTKIQLGRCSTWGQLQRRGRARGTSSRRRVSTLPWRRVSTLPWMAIDPNLDTAPPQLLFRQANVARPLPTNPSPVDYFRHLFDDRALKCIVDETNRYKYMTLYAYTNRNSLQSFCSIGFLHMYTRNAIDL